MVDFSPGPGAPISPAVHQTATSLERITEAIADHVASVLNTTVVVLDRRGTILSSNQPAIVGQSYDPHNPDHPHDDYWVPLMYENLTGRVVACQPAHGEVLSSRLLKNIVELICQQLRLDWQPNTRELTETFFHKLFHGSMPDEATLRHEAAVIGFDLDLAYQLLVIDAPLYILGAHAFQLPETGDLQVRRRAQTIINIIQHSHRHVEHMQCTYIGNGEIVMLRPCTQPSVGCCTAADGSQSCSWAQMSLLRHTADHLLQQFHASIDPAISIGIGRHHPGPDGLRRSYDEARAAITLGRRFHHADKTYAINQLGIAAFVGLPDERTKADLAAHVLCALQNEPDLLKTLAAFFAEDCCPSATVKHLCVHRNTLTYRLEKIAQLTGLDPRKFDDAVQLRLALMLRDVSAAPLASPSFA